MGRYVFTMAVPSENVRFENTESCKKDKMVFFNSYDVLKFHLFIHTTNYLFLAERYCFLKYCPDHSFRAAWCGEGPLVAEVPLQFIMGENKHV